MGQVFFGEKCVSVTHGDGAFKSQYFYIRNFLNVIDYSLLKMHYTVEPCDCIKLLLFKHVIIN